MYSYVKWIAPALLLVVAGTHVSPLYAQHGGTARLDATTAVLDPIITPEPETYLLAGAALIALGLIGRKRRSKR